MTKYAIYIFYCVQFAKCSSLVYNLLIIAMLYILPLSHNCTLVYTKSASVFIVY